MRHSLEVRPPFLDHRIVEFAASLPERLKIRGGTQKFVLRELMRGKITGDGAEAEEDGFRHTDSRLVPGPAAGIAEGYGDAGSDGGDRHFRRARD